MRNLFALLAVLVAVNAFPETGHEAWLRYASVNSVIPYEDVVVVGKSEVVATAQAELGRGFRSMLGREVRLGRPYLPSCDCHRDNRRFERCIPYQRAGRLAL